MSQYAFIWTEYGDEPNGGEYLYGTAGCGGGECNSLYDIIAFILRGICFDRLATLVAISGKCINPIKDFLLKNLTIGHVIFKDR